MEQYIDSSLESFTPFLNKLKIAGGILLIMIGMFLVVKNKITPKNNELTQNILPLIVRSVSRGNEGMVTFLQVNK